ncbi:Probable serine/threonine-protein kinase At1g09600 [Linum grandiflorum]
MGCICSKGAQEQDITPPTNNKDHNKSNLDVQLVAPTPSKTEEFFHHQSSYASSRRGSKHYSRQASKVSNHNPNPVKIGKNNGAVVEENNGKLISRSARHHQRGTTMDLPNGFYLPRVSRTFSMPCDGDGDIDPGWPQWLTSVAGDAVRGWLPRQANSFEKLEKIGEGTYSTVYRARDLQTGKIVAMKKVRFVNMDPESVRFMAREINILRKLDHPNVMKLECIVTSRMSESLYLVFEYMDHDLTGLTTRPGAKFTEPQIKCYMQQLLRGLQHCHECGILHRDIKGSNLLINDDGVLKLGDFGLANFYCDSSQQALTSRVVTLWYRAPELLLGATQYGVGIDLWSAGCILAELFAGKHVEQMHKIFKLCGSPSEEYWHKTRFPHATSFKPQQPYKRCVQEAFKNFPPSALALVDQLLSIEPEARGTAASALQSQFFKTKPFPCEPSALPKYPPSKELDAKAREEEARRKMAEAMKNRGAESVRGQRTEMDSPGKVQGKPSNSHKYEDEGGGATGGMRMMRPNAAGAGYNQTCSMIHPVSGLNNRNEFRNRNNSIMSELRTQNHSTRSQQQTVDMSIAWRKTAANSNNGGSSLNIKDSSVVYVPPRKNRINYSGPLMPPGGNMEELLKEHERQIQQAVRKARSKDNLTSGEDCQNQHQNSRYGG